MPCLISSKRMKHLRRSLPSYPSMPPMERHSVPSTAFPIFVVTSVDQERSLPAFGLAILKTCCLPVWTLGSRVVIPWCREMIPFPSPNQKPGSSVFRVAICSDGLLHHHQTVPLSQVRATSRSPRCHRSSTLSTVIVHVFWRRLAYLLPTSRNQKVI